MNKIDVLKRAKKMLEAGPLPPSHSEHGEYCPYCAIALAKSQLDIEEGTSPFDHLSEIVDGLVTGKRVILESDIPLEEARVGLGILEQPFTKEKSLYAINKALGD